MLWLTKLSVENFGPFKGEQEILFPRDAGVTIIRGENMHGKTSILNAMRFALFGRAVGRHSRVIPISKLINWESKSEGDYQLSVALEFSLDEEQYVLRRRLRPRHGVGVPDDEMDFEPVLVTLTRGGTMLSPEKTAQELAKIMPEEISRFFLFDGELLQEYEDLIVEETTAGQEIKRAIERILGLPILTNARHDLRTICDDAGSLESKEAARDKKTREIAMNLQFNQNLRKEHIDAHTEWQRKEEALKTREAELNALLLPKQGVTKLIEERGVLKAKVGQALNERAKIRDDIRQAMTDAWLWLIQPGVSVRLEALDAEIEAANERVVRRAEESERAKLAQDSLDDLRCALCGQAVPPEAEPVLMASVRRESELTTTDEDHSNKMIYDVESLQSLRTDDREIQKLLGLLEKSDQAAVEIQVAEDRREAIQEDLEAFDEAAIASAVGELKQVSANLQLAQDGKKTEKDEIDGLSFQIRNLQEKLDRLGSTQTARFSRKRALAEQLSRLFASSVDQYRDSLQGRIENDATRIFLRLTTEPDYARLTINDRYGLRIVHKDGTEIDVRSAGAEHVVALSLTGALQQNAPLKGPIVMDSPFGRLDEQHTRNVIAALPTLSEQLVLLVYEKEIDDIEEARELLDGHIRAEYELRRISAKKSEIGRV